MRVLSNSEICLFTVTLRKQQKSKISKENFIQESTHIFGKMVRMKFSRGIKIPCGINWTGINTPGRENLGNKSKIMRLVNNGCANRAFYHINVERVSI